MDHVISFTDLHTRRQLRSVRKDWSERVKSTSEKLVVENKIQLKCICCLGCRLGGDSCADYTIASRIYPLCDEFEEMDVLSQLAYLLLLRGFLRAYYNYGPNRCSLSCHRKDIRRLMDEISTRANSKWFDSPTIKSKIESLNATIKKSQNIVPLLFRKREDGWKLTAENKFVFDDGGDKKTYVVHSWSRGLADQPPLSFGSRGATPFKLRNQGFTAQCPDDGIQCPDDLMDNTTISTSVTTTSMIDRSCNCKNTEKKEPGWRPRWWAA